MKNIFKKNQIIITALAIMIIIAGYLNFMDKKSTEDVGVNGAQDYNTYGETADDDITDGDMVDVENSGLVADDETNPDSQVASGEEGEDDEEVAMDISDEDIQLPVADNGEVVTDEADADVEADTETSAPGEAILVSTTLNSNYFASAKLEREQIRAASQERFREIIDNTNLSEDAKVDAINGLLNLTTLAKNENEIETLLESKGYSDAIVSISEGSVDVIVNSEAITEQDVAKIEDVIKRKTGVKSAEIFIQPVVMGE